MVPEVLLAAQQVTPEQVSTFARTELSPHDAAVVGANDNACRAFDIHVSAAL